MDKEMIESLEKLKMQILKELCSYSTKLTSAQAFHEVKELTEAAKDLCKLIHMLKNGHQTETSEERYDDGASFGSYRHNYDMGSSNRGRGRSMNGYEFAGELYSLANRTDDPHMRERMMELARESEARFR